MARWEPDAPGRLLAAAVELFTEHGYDVTTAAQIADRAGLTRATLFRHFADKREILFQGQESSVELVTRTVAGADPSAPPWQVLRSAISTLCALHTAERHALGRQLDAILSSSAELQERAAAKRMAIAEALHRALTERISDARGAGVLADVGVRAYYEGFRHWVGGPGDGPLQPTVARELAAYAAALGTWSPQPVADVGRPAAG